MYNNNNTQVHIGHTSQVSLHNVIYILRTFLQNLITTVLFGFCLKKKMNKMLLVEVSVGPGDEAR